MSTVGVMRILMAVVFIISYHVVFNCRAIEASDSRPYGTMIREAPEFRNPLDVSNMAASFGLGDVDRQPSLMRGLFK